MTGDQRSETAAGALKEAPRLKRRHAEIAEVEHLRHSEMQSISDRLARVGDFPWARMWVALATLAGGAFTGGAVALIPFLTTTPAPSGEHELIYFSALAFVALVALLGALSAATAHHERMESISAIKTDFDKHILASFEEAEEPSSRG